MPVALVTGGSNRVGKAVVNRLAAAGFDIAFTYLSSGIAAEALTRELQTNGRRAISIRADLTKPDQAVAQIAASYHQSFSSLDVLVNNASLYEPSSLINTNLTQIRRLNAIHFESPLLLCQAFAADLRAAHGHVINMIDLLAEKPMPQYMAYCASKAALRNLTLSLARELAPEVTVNGIAPGVVAWPPDMPEADKNKYLSRVPLARSGTPQDVAELVYFLATTGSYITGQIINLDGGRSIT